MTVLSIAIRANFLSQSSGPVAILLQFPFQHTSAGIRGLRDSLFGLHFSELYPVPPFLTW